MAVVNTIMGIDTAKYFCSTEAQFNVAITAIGTGAGIIYLTGNFTATATLNIDGGGSYIIQGMGNKRVITATDTVTVFNITSAKSCIIRDFKIDSTNYTDNYNVINIDESSDNQVIVDNMYILSDSYGYGVRIASNNCIVRNCFLGLLGLLNIAVFLNGGHYSTVEDNVCAAYDCIMVQTNYNKIEGNTLSGSTGIYLNNASYNTINGNYAGDFLRGIALYNTSSYNTITGNITVGNNGTVWGVANVNGIRIDGQGDYNIVMGNQCYNTKNAGAGGAYSIEIFGAGCFENTVISNLCHQYKSGWFQNTGTNTYQTDNRNWA